MGVTVVKPEEEWRREIGERIVQARKELGMRQVELADLVHVSERSMQAYERGEVFPWRFLSDISAVLGKSRDWILHGTEASEAGLPEVRAALEKIQRTLDRNVELLEQLLGSPDGVAE